MRGVGIIAAIDLARNDDSYGRLALLHGANLYWRSVSAEKQRSGRPFRQIKIEGVHIVADGVMLGNVERFEIVIGRFNFRAFNDGEAY